LISPKYSGTKNGTSTCLIHRARLSQDKLLSILDKRVSAEEPSKVIFTE